MENEFSCYKTFFSKKTTRYCLMTIHDEFVVTESRSEYTVQNSSAVEFVVLFYLLKLFMFIFLQNCYR